MRYISGLLAIIILLSASAARADTNGAGDFTPDEFRVTPYCGVYHFDRNKIRNGRHLNEEPWCMGGALGWKVDDTIKAGVMAMDFRNSIYKRTVIAGAYVEDDLYQNVKKDGLIDDCGLGLTAGGQIVKGYDTPVIGEVYGYCEKWRVRANMTIVPPLGSEVDAAAIWTVDLKLWEFQ